MVFRRKKFERREPEVHVVDVVVSGSRHRAKVLDISEGGMKIEVEESLRINQEVDLLMTSEDGKELRRRASVVWFTLKSNPARSRVGLKYILSAKDWMKKGGALYDSGKYYDAINAYASAIDLNPGSGLAYFNRGIIYYRIGNYRQTLSDFRVAAKLGHQKARALLKSRGIGW
jgi:tetratricopeptide (TPR) repeat protein